jgi:hypothetical protein
MREVEALLVLRPELSGSMFSDVGKGMRELFSMSSADFKGKRVMPRDLVEVLGKQFDVIGGRTDVGEVDLVTIQPQALIDTKAIQIIAFADGGLKISGRINLWEFGNLYIPFLNLYRVLIQGINISGDSRKVVEKKE